jgi:hypothetical protein
LNQQAVCVPLSIDDEFIMIRRILYPAADGTFGTYWRVALALTSSSLVIGDDQVARRANTNYLFI